MTLPDTQCSLMRVECIPSGGFNPEESLPVTEFLTRVALHDLAGCHTEMTREFVLEMQPRARR